MYFPSLPIICRGLCLLITYTYLHHLYFSFPPPSLLSSVCRLTMMPSKQSLFSIMREQMRWLRCSSTQITRAGLSKKVCVCVCVCVCVRVCVYAWPPLCSSKGGKHKTWKKRWFILTENCLYYFKSPNVSIHVHTHLHSLLQMYLMPGQGAKRDHSAGEPRGSKCGSGEEKCESLNSKTITFLLHEWLFMTLIVWWFSYCVYDSYCVCVSLTRVL